VLGLLERFAALLKTDPSVDAMFRVSTSPDPLALAIA
jgi:hypothetical protein